MINSNQKKVLLLIIFLFFLISSATSNEVSWNEEDWEDVEVREGISLSDIGDRETGILRLGLDIEHDYIDNHGFAYWTLDQDDDSTDGIIDEIGGHHGTRMDTMHTVQDGSLSTPAQEGEGEEDDDEWGSDRGRINIGQLDNFGSSMDQGWSMSVTVKPEASDLVQALIGSNNEGGDTVWGPNLNRPEDNDLHFRFRDEDRTSVGVRAEGALEENEYQRLTFVKREGGTIDDLEIYIDGEEVNTEVHDDEGTLDGGFQNFDQDNFLGAHNPSCCDPARNIDGIMDDYVMFDEALDSVEVYEDYQTLKEGKIISQSETTAEELDPESLELTDLDYELNGETVEVVVQTDEGESSDSIELTGNNNYDVAELSEETDTFKIEVNLETEDLDSSPVVREVGLSGESANEPPEIESVVSPGDGESEVGLGPDLEVDVYDPDGDDMTVTFYEGGPGEDELGSSSATNTENAVLEAEDHNLGEEPGTEYEWSIEVDDGEETVESDTWSFTTVYEPEIVEASADPDGETVSTAPELSVEVEHEDDREMDVAFFVKGEGFVDEVEGFDGVETSVSVDDRLDADESYDWYVEVDDGEFEVSSEDSPWSFDTDSGDPEINVAEDSDGVNLNPFDQGVLNVELDHSHANQLDNVTLYNEAGEIMDYYDGGASAGETLSLLWPEEELEPNQEYEWSAEVEHAGETAQTETVSFTTIAVEVALSGNVPNAEGYNIYRREDSEISDPTFDYGDEDYQTVGIVDELDNVIRDVSEGLGTGKTYCYVATAYNVGGEGPGSDEVCMEGEVQLE